jgi:hypothetical protein
LASIEKELQQMKKDNVARARYINTRRKKDEDRRKEEEEGRRKTMVVAPTSDKSQNSKDVRT